MTLNLLAAELHEVEQSLEQLRRSILHRRGDALGDLDLLLERAEALRDRAAGSDYEPSARVICDLLVSVRRGLEVQAKVAGARRMAA